MVRPAAPPLWRRALSVLRCRSRRRARLSRLQRGCQAQLTSSLYPADMRVCTPALALLVLAACSSSPPSNPAPGPGGTAVSRIRVLMFTATAGFRHDSISVARETMTAMGAVSTDFIVTATEDLGMLSSTALTNFDVV